MRGLRAKGISVSTFRYSTRRVSVIEMQIPATRAGPQLSRRWMLVVTGVVTGNLVFWPDAIAMPGCRPPQGFAARKDPSISSGQLENQTRKRRRPQSPVAFGACRSLLATLAAMVAKSPENVAAQIAPESRIHPHDSEAVGKGWQFHATSLRQSGASRTATPFRFAATVAKAFCHARHAVVR